MIFHILPAPKSHWSAPRLPRVSCFCRRVPVGLAQALVTRPSRAFQKQSNTQRRFSESTHLPSAASLYHPTTSFAASQSTPMKPATPEFNFEVQQRKHWKRRDLSNRGYLRFDAKPIMTGSWVLHWIGNARCQEVCAVLHLLVEFATPNHALQRTAPRVTVAAVSGLWASRPCVPLF